MDSRYWPGTKILKSQNNDFDWRNRVSRPSDNKSLIAQRNATTERAKQNRSDIYFAKEKS